MSMFDNPYHPEVKLYVDKWWKISDELLEQGDNASISLHNQENDAYCEAKKRDREISERLQK